MTWKNIDKKRAYQKRWIELKRARTTGSITQKAQVMSEKQAIFCILCNSTKTIVENGIHPAFCSRDCQEKYVYNYPKITSHYAIHDEENLKQEPKEVDLKQEPKEVDIKDTEFDKFRSSKYGVCDIIKAHHAVLKDDPERLTSEFLIESICGTDRKYSYIEKKIQSRERGLSKNAGSQKREKG